MDLSNTPMENSFCDNRNSTAGKAASPYADSPYVSYYEMNGQEHPVKEGSQKARATQGGKNGSIRWISVLLVIILVFGSCTTTALLMNHSWQQKYDRLNSVMSNKLSAMQSMIEDMTGRNITVGTSAAPTEGLTPAQIYTQNESAVVAISSDISTGTGFVITEDGYIVSNYHVVEGGAYLQVVTVDGQMYEAQLIGYDKANDVSLLKVEASGLRCVTIGNSDGMAVGDQVVAIGNALGELTSTLTVGYISGKDRIISTDGTAINMLQTDAAINSGNSGGPLFNMYGEVIGITTAKYTGESSSGATIEGIGFAIPINDVFGMIEDLREFGYITGPYLGVSVRDVDTAVIQNYGFPAGAYVVEVVDGLSADRAGVQPKDIITNVGGYDVTSVSVLTRVLRKFEAGETTTITVFRSGAELHLEVTFDEKPQAQESDNSQSQQTPEVPETPDGTYPWWFDYFPPFFGED